MRRSIRLIVSRVAIIGLLSSCLKEDPDMHEQNLTSEPAHITAHKHSIFHKKEILQSDYCGCFYCREIYSPAEIKEWTDTSKPEGEHTALCPHCGIDSVIGSSSGFPITKEFLEQMNSHWF